MKKSLLFLVAVFAVLSVTAQQLVYNQNPRFEESRSKYLILADSLNRTQSTTLQNTYKAIDYLADRDEARAERRRFRQELRMERARNGYYNGGWGGYYNPYRRYSGYYRPFYNNQWYNPLVSGTIGSPFFWYWLAR